MPNIKPGAYPNIGEGAKNAFLSPASGVRRIDFDKYFANFEQSTLDSYAQLAARRRQLSKEQLFLAGGPGGGADVDVLDEVPEAYFRKDFSLETHDMFRQSIAKSFATHHEMTANMADYLTCVEDALFRQVRGTDPVGE